MQDIAVETVRITPWRRARVALVGAARRPWTWVALAYLALAVTLAWDTPSVTRFLGSLVWTTLGIAIVVWTVMIWRIVYDTRFGRD